MSQGDAIERIAAAVKEMRVDGSPEEMVQQALNGKGLGWLQGSLRKKLPLIKRVIVICREHGGMIPVSETTRAASDLMRLHELCEKQPRLSAQAEFIAKTIGPFLANKPVPHFVDPGTKKIRVRKKMAVA
ncbi:MAG: hypothetical protein ABIE68_00390 [bacterium]